MRTWVGREMEGNCCDKTLFVESEVVDVSLAIKVLRYAKLNHIGRIYFGAGRVDVKFDDDAKKVLDISGVEVVVETTPMGYAHCKDIDAKIVLRIEMPSIAYNPNMVLKIDNMTSWCSVSNELIPTDISYVSNGMYEDDEEVQI